MEIPNMEELETKLKIAVAAVDLYVEQDGEFTIHDVAASSDMAVAEIFEYFPNKKAILEFYYTSLIIRYRLMVEEIEDFNTYTLSEKLSNFMYASLDLLGEKKEFIQMSFDSLIRCSYTKTPFEKEAESVLTDFIKNDQGLSAGSQLLLNRLLYEVMLQKYLYIIGYWLTDDSENKERTIEFIDKLTAFIQEILYNKVADQGFELLKFLFTNSRFTSSIWDNFSSKFEIR